MPPEDAFGVLGNRIRMAILRTLWESPERAVPYAELERRTPVSTDNFNYHLEKLVGQFVRRSDDGYTLRYAGEHVVRAVVTGVFTEDPSLEPVVIDSRCPYCGSPVELRYADERLTARCTSCGGVIDDEEYPQGTYMSYGFPPSGLAGRTPEELLEAAHVFYDSKVTPMMDGVCPECAARVDHAISTCEDHAPGDDGLCRACDTRFAVWTEYTCERCEYARRVPPWFRLLNEPAVISFYHEHGDFEQTVPFKKLTWENAPFVRSISQSVASTDPLEILVEFPLGDAALAVTIDADLEILAVERSDGR